MEALETSKDSETYARVAGELHMTSLEMRLQQVLPPTIYNIFESGRNLHMHVAQSDGSAVLGN